MDLKLNIAPVLRITAALILFSCLCLSGQKADAIKQVPVITPQPGPPPHVIKAASFDKWAGQEIISAFKERGLEVVIIQKGITMGSRQAKESTLFLIPSAGDNIGGLVLSYSSQIALEEDRKYYSGMNKPSAPPAWRIFQRENILLLISGKVSEEKAIRYKKALDQL